jgi:hypothetical protein
VCHAKGRKALNARRRRRVTEANNMPVTRNQFSSDRA